MHYLSLRIKSKGERSKRSAKYCPTIIRKPQFKEPTVYVPPPVEEYQPWNQIPDFAKKTMKF